MSETTRAPQPLSQHLRATLGLGLPLIGAHLAQIAIGVTDTLMLGRYGIEALNASILGASFFFTFFILGTGFAGAVLPKVAAAAATGDLTQARRSSRMGIWISLGFAVLSYPLFWYSEAILLALGQVPQISADAQVYLRIAGLGMVPALLVASLRATLSGLERTRVVLWATLLGAAGNVAGNYVLIFGMFGAPELGLVGAAIASLFVHVIMAVILVFYSARALPEFAFFTRLWRPDWAEFASIFRLGWPISVTLLAEVGMFSASALLMGTLGAVALAAHGIALQIASATFMVHMGLASAATVRIGAAYGRGEAVNLRRAALAGLILSGATVAMTVAVFLGLPGLLIGAFLNSAEPLRAEILALGVVLLALAALFQLFDAAQVMALGFLRGMQDTRRPMIYAWIGYWGVGMPAAYGLVFYTGIGPSGVWLGLVLGLAVAGCLLAARFWRAQARL